MDTKAKKKNHYSWLVGADWPNNGEIDIIEGVNQQSGNDMTLHTSDGCSISSSSDFTGSMTTDNCYVYAAGQSSNAGCGITDPDATSYGTAFNANGGGVFATEWTSDAISIWFFERGNIPDDIDSGNPDPDSWGSPVARFQGDCDIDSHFDGLQIVCSLSPFPPSFLLFACCWFAMMGGGR